MKAAVLHKLGATPTYEDFPDPVAGENEILVQVKAVPLENVDKAVAKGSHYASQQFMPTLPAIIGFDGIGTLQDGRLVGFGGIRAPYGAMAETTVIRDMYYVPVLHGMDAVTAAAVPASALTSYLPLRCGVNLQPDQTVLINGATGFSGKLGVQIAKLLGAKRVVGTGRNDAALESLFQLGADAVIDLKQSDAEVVEAFRAEAGEDGYHVIIDFLWGHVTELLISALVPHEISFPKHKIQLVQIGEMAGPTISLPADSLRTSGLEIIGATGGLTPESMAASTNQVSEWIVNGKLHADIEQVPLKDIAQAWERTDVHGKRLVIVP